MVEVGVERFPARDRRRADLLRAAEGFAGDLRPRRSVAAGRAACLAGRRAPIARAPVPRRVRSRRRARFLQMVGRVDGRSQSHMDRD